MSRLHAGQYPDGMIEDTYEAEEIHAINKHTKGGSYAESEPVRFSSIK